MALTTAGIGVDLVYQFTHGVFTRANHVGRVAPRRSHQAVADHQQAEVVARQITLHHHFAIFGGGFVAQFQMGLGGDVDGDPFALVAVLGFHHHRQTDFVGGTPGIFHIHHRAAKWHGHTGSMQKFFGQVFVLRNGLGHGTGRVQFSSLDAALA